MTGETATKTNWFNHTPADFFFQTIHLVHYDSILTPLILVTIF